LWDNQKLETRIQTGYWLIHAKSQHLQKRAFRVKKRDHRILTQDKKKLAKRLKRKTCGST
jgi:hypothetical protein